MSRPPLLGRTLDAEGTLSTLGLHSNSQRNLATLGSLKAMKSPPPLNHLALNDVRHDNFTSKTTKRLGREITLKFPAPESLEPVEASKRLAARRAVEDHFPKDAKVIGIGSGSTVIYAVERILEMDNLDEVTFIPTGFQSKELINGGGLRLGEIDSHPNIDVAFDGADEVDSKLQCIKGGGACLFQEKLVASCAAKFVIVADYRKNSELLGQKWQQGVPIEIVPLAHAKVIRDLVRLGAIDPALRMGGKAKAGPVLTDNGNFIIDAPFELGKDPIKLQSEIKSLCGVVECGLFVNMAEVAYFGNEDGSVDVRYANGKVEHVNAGSTDAPVSKAASRRESMSTVGQPETREPGWLQPAGETKTTIPESAKRKRNDDSIYQDLLLVLTDLKGAHLLDTATKQAASVRSKLHKNQYKSLTEVLRDLDTLQADSIKSKSTDPQAEHFFRSAIKLVEYEIERSGQKATVASDDSKRLQASFTAGPTIRSKALFMSTTSGPLYTSRLSSTLATGSPGIPAYMLDVDVIPSAPSTPRLLGDLSLPSKAKEHRDALNVRLQSILSTKRMKQGDFETFGPVEDRTDAMLPFENVAGCLYDRVFTEIEEPESKAQESDAKDFEFDESLLDTFESEDEVTKLIARLSTLQDTRIQRSPMAIPTDEEQRLAKQIRELLQSKIIDTGLKPKDLITNGVRQDYTFVRYTPSYTGSLPSTIAQIVPTTTFQTTPHAPRHPLERPVETKPVDKSYLNGPRTVPRPVSTVSTPSKS